MNEQTNKRINKQKQSFFNCFTTLVFVDLDELNLFSLHRLELPTLAPIEAFTMSVDRGYLGRTPGDNNPNMYKSMDDLTAQKATGLELVRLLRVSYFRFFFVTLFVSHKAQRTSNLFLDVLIHFSNLIFGQKLAKMGIKDNFEDSGDIK
jgi:hypothetical protein